jgi:hypothetical protein
MDGIPFFYIAMYAIKFDKSVLRALWIVGQQEGCQVLQAFSVAYVCHN